MESTVKVIKIVDARLILGKRKFGGTETFMFTMINDHNTMFVCGTVNKEQAQELVNHLKCEFKLT